MVSKQGWMDDDGEEDDGGDDAKGGGGDDDKDDNDVSSLWMPVLSPEYIYIT